MSTKKIGALVRVSTNRQDLENQKIQVREWMARQGLAGEPEWYEELGVSGASQRRPVLDELIRDCKKGKVDTVVVVALDRVGRSIVRVMLSLHQILDAGADLVSLREGLDFRGPVGRMIAAVMAALAEFERDLIKERTIRGVRRAQAQGVHCGRPALRFTPRQKAKLILLRRDGVSTARIAREKMVSCIRPTRQENGSFKDVTTWPSARTLRRLLVDEGLEPATAE